MSLDPTLLQKARHQAPGKITARCPACAEGGGDRAGNHLVLFADGRFACAAHPGDAGHRSRIHALAGREHPMPPPTHQQRRDRQRDAAREHRLRQDAENLATATRHHRATLLADHAWAPEDVWEDSPQRIDSPLVESCPRHFLATLFPPDAVLWAGRVHDSGTPCRSRHWRTCREWLDARPATVGPMTTPAIWRRGIHSRSAPHVLRAPYTVLDFDGLDGRKPATPAALEQHLMDSLAIIRWLRQRHRWQLSAILHTGGKSLHAWFRTPPPDALRSLRDAATPLGIDPGLIGRPEHPCRLPGHPHPRTGRPSRVLWLQVPEEG